MRLIRLNCLHADVKFLADLTGSVPFSNQPENLKLAICQVGDGGPLRYLIPANKTMEDPVGHPVADIDLSAEDPANRYQHPLRRLLLHDVAASAGTQGPFSI